MTIGDFEMSLSVEDKKSFGDEMKDLLAEFDAKKKLILDRHLEKVDEYKKGIEQRIPLLTLEESGNLRNFFLRTRESAQTGFFNLTRNDPVMPQLVRNGIVLLIDDDKVLGSDDVLPDHPVDFHINKELYEHCSRRFF